MKKCTLFTLGLGLLLTCSNIGFSATVPTDTPIALVSGETTSCDGITGTGTLTISTTDAVLNDASTFGTLQFVSSADFTGFTGALSFTSSNIDLNSNSLSVTTISAGSVTADSVTTYDTTSAIINTGAAQAVLTLTGGSSYHARIGNSDGTNSDIQVVMTGTSTRNLYSRQYYTGGTNVTGGTFGLLATSNDEAVDMFGSGAISLNGVTFNAQNGRTYSFSNDVTISGAINLRMQGASTMNFSGAVSGSGSINVPYDGGSVIFSGSAKTYTGKTVIGTLTNAWANASATATLRIDGDNFIPTGTTLEMGGAYGGSILNLNGFNQTVANLSGKGTLKTSTDGASTLTVASGTVSADMTLEKNTTLKIANGSHFLSTHGAGTLDFAGGNILITDALDAGTMVIQNDTTISNAPALWGKTVLSGIDFTNPKNITVYKADTNELNAKNDDSVFPNSTTMSFAGLFEVTETTQLSFMKNFDDQGVVWVTPVNEDGTLGTRQVLIQSTLGTSADTGTILYNGGDTSSWNDVFVAETTLNAGRYIFEVRGGQGGGGVGPNYSTNALGIGVKSGANSTLETFIADYQALTITDGLLAGISTIKAVSPQNVSVASNIQIADGKTLTFDAGAGGSMNLTGNISGNGSNLVLNGTGDGAKFSVGGSNTYTGTTTVNVPTLSIASIKPFGTGTITFEQETDVNFDFSSSELVASPWQLGTIVATNMQTSTIPDSLTRTSTASYTGTSPGETTTRVYLSSTLSTNEDFTMYFGKAYDDAAYLKVTDLTDDSLSSVVINHIQWDAFAKGSYNFLEGHLYALDLRVYNGSGGAGPTSEQYGMPTGTGFGASVTGFNADGNANDSFKQMNFDADGFLAGSALHASTFVTFDGNMVLNQNVSFNASNIDGVVFNGTFSGAGALTLKNGAFNVKSSANTVGGLSIENATYALSKTAGGMTIDGDLSIVDSTLNVNLTDWTPADTAAFIKFSGDQTAQNSNLVFNLDGLTFTDPTISVALFENTSGTLLPDEFWEGFRFSILNSDYIGQLKSDANMLYITFGTNDSLPEPSAYILFLLGLLGLSRLRFRRKGFMLLR